MARLRDKDREPRSGNAGQSYVRRIPDTKKTFRQWISEPGAVAVVVVLVVGLGLVWACCLVTGAVLSGFLVERSALRTFMLGNVLFGMILAGWIVLGGSRKLLLMEGGAMDRIGGIFKREEKPLEFDAAPAMLARKRGNPEEAIRLYRSAARALPHRLDLHYRIAEIEHLDRRQIDVAARGYRDFLRRLDQAGRPCTPEEEDCAALARTRLADLERSGKEPPPRREIVI